MKIAAIIVCAGKSKRLKSKINKAYIKLRHLPILVYSLRVLSKIKNVAEIIMVVNRNDLKRARVLLKKYPVTKPIRIVFGAKERYLSVLNGLKAVGEDIQIVLIHDAARPFISVKVVQAAIQAAVKHKAACIGVPVIPTIKQANQGNYAARTLERAKLWEIQTPQVFDKKLLNLAYQKLKYNNVTDDAQVLEYAGKKVKIVKGEYSNIKITTPLDLKLARELIRHGKKF